MEKDERLLPLPNVKDIQPITKDYPASYSPLYDDEFGGHQSLREYFAVVYKRLPLIIALALIVTVLAAFYMYRQPLLYSAQTTMIIEPRKPKVQSKDAININFGNDQNYYNTQLKLLQNYDLMREVVMRLELYRQPNLLSQQSKGIGSTLQSIFSGDKKTLEKEGTLPVLTDETLNASGNQPVLSPEEKELVDSYAGTLAGGLSVEQVEKTNLVNIRVQSTNPALAAKVADTVANVFIEQDVQRETQGAKKAYEDLSQSIEDLKTNIAGQESELIAYMKDSGLPLASKGEDLSASRLQEISGQWLAATDQRRGLEARYNAAVQANARGEGVNIPDLTESKIYQDTVRINAERKAKLQDRIREIEKQINDAETEKAQLLVKYTPENPKVIVKDEEISKLSQIKAQSEQEISKTIEADQTKLEQEAINGALISLKSQLDAAAKREEQARGTYLNEVSAANVQGQAQTKLTTLKREIETNRNLLDSYIQQQKQRELEISSSRPDNVKISSEAVVPTAPIGPQRNRNIFIAFLVSLAAGVGLAFLLDYLDDSVKTSDDIGRHLGLPTLALIPHLSAAAVKRRLLPGKNGVGSTALISLEDNHSAMAEAYRHLRTSLLFSSAGKPPQTILVTSAQPAEGKTTTAINTAITLAQGGADVVIVDCDLRRPRLHNHFNLENASGLTNYLSGDRDTSSLLKPYAELPNLKIVTSGPVPPNPAELLSSNEMKNLLQLLKGKFKHVVVDSPPAISFTDAAILSTQVDGVILVALAGKSSIHLLRRFKQRLATIGARIYGVVLNGIKANSTEYGYYGYGYNDYYKSADDDDFGSGNGAEAEEIEEMFSSMQSKK